MRKTVSLALIFILTTLTVANPLLQEPSQSKSAATAELTNNDVVEMTKSGLAAEVIIAKIKTSPSRFDTSPLTLAKLKEAGLSDAVLTAMVIGRVDPLAASSASMAEVEVKVPDGTEVEVQLANTLSGQSARLGDVVDFLVIRPVQ